jgi:uncharacterized membrane protein
MTAMPRLHTEKTSVMGLDANVAAALSYLFGFVTGAVVLLLEKKDRFVRFHALQSALAFGGITLFWLLMSAIPVLGFIIGVLVIIPGSAILWLVLMFKAYQGEEFRLPIVGQIAADRIHSWPPS